MNTLPQWLYELLTSEVIYYLVGIWLLIDLFAVKRRKELLYRLNLLLIKPTIFKPDGEPTSIPLYPRGIFEDAANGFKNALNKPFQGILGALRKTMNLLTRNVVNPQKKWLVLGYAIFFLLTILFIFADAIAIANTLVFTGLLDIDTLWEPLTKYEFAAAAGSLFALIVSGFVLSEMNRQKSEFSDWDQTKGAWRRISGGIINILLVLGFIAVLFLALQRLIALGYFSEYSSTIKFGVDLAVAVLIPVNTVLATFLIFSDGIKGFYLLIIMMIGILFAITYVLDYIALVIGVGLPFIIDILYRIAYIVVSFLWFILVTPIELLVSVVSAPFKPRP